MLTDDISELALTRFADVCGFLACQQLDLAAVLYSESGWYATAHNPNGDASGIFQAMPATLKGLGFAPELPPDARAAKFRTLTAADQMPWLKRYYAPYRGKLNSVTACYLATFLPADLAHAGDDQYVLAQKGGYRGVIYTANAAFDANRDLCIRVGELGQAVRRNCIGPRWAELVSRLSGGAVSPQGQVGSPVGGIRWAQERLVALGFAPGVADGVWGPRTQAALVAFQRSVHLVPDGILGPLTMAKLKAGA